MVLVLGGLSFAQSSRYASYQGSTSGPLIGQSVVNTRGSVIYNITLNSTSANAGIAIYDQATLPIDTLAPYYETAIYEVEVSSNGNTATVDFSTAPLNTYNGVVVSVVNGTAFLNMQK